MYIVKNFEFIGYDDFFTNVLPDIYDIVNSYGISDAIDEFVSALTEAICNAAIYSTDGMEYAKILMNIILTDDQIKITVSSVTVKFDANDFKTKLKKIAVSPDGNLDWQQFVGISQQGRGIWIMLSFFDAVCVGRDGNEITLISRVPLRCAEVNTIKKIVHKFFVVQDGVIT